MPRFCTHPDHTFIEFESDADIALHTLQHLVALELAMSDFTALSAKVDSLIAAYEGEKTDQASIDAITAKIDAALPAAPVDTVPPVDGSVPVDDGSQPAV